MTHFKVEIQLPLFYNQQPNEIERKKIERPKFVLTYDELYKMFDGVNTSNAPIMGAYKSKKTGKRIDDSNIVFTVLIDSEDRMTIHKIQGIKQLQNYKEQLKQRFDQEEIFMVATRCIWI